MRRNCLFSLSLLLLWGCAHQGHHASEVQGPASITAPFSEKAPTARSLDADGDGVLTQGDAEWFGMVVDALGDAPKAGTLHYAGLKAPTEVWTAIGFGTSVPAVDKVPGLSTADRYGLSVDAGYAQKAVQSLKTDVKDLSLPLSGLALRGRFIANRDAAEMTSLCEELASFVPGDASDLLNETPHYAVFDLDDTVWAGHIMDLGILAIAHGGLWSSTGLNGIAKELGLTVSGDVIKTAEEWVRRMRLPYGDAKLVSRKDGFFALVKAMRGLQRAAVKDAVAKAFTVKLGTEAPWENRFLGRSGCTLRRWMGLWREAGGKVLLVSATPDVFVEATQEHLGQSSGTPYRGSQLTESGGVFDGTLAQSIYGTKAAVIREALGRSPWFVFGDSVNSDGPMYLVNLGWSFHINPGAKFPSWDAERGGQVRSLILPQELSPKSEGELLTRGDDS